MRSCTPVQDKSRKDCYNGDIQSKMDEVYVQCTNAYKSFQNQVLFQAIL